ncbi:GMC family oxidoreductase [Patulibacter sp.]|uniref:GMC family oxidoreductase n=1 Tax=Patulibacter sp. TaxID=1912859 RepID=UPI00272257E9|nr:GMC family oxidoreductase N-terminal domain-containing protein [Patulibacter sp.]MDO9410787.1 GMC family oxidoreductase N-terminal domain-containing protein [Patulibacter sp.]
MPSADYVIVGAGSAGCVLANRLSEDPDVRVLLLEAGGKDGSVNVKIPAAFPNQFHTKMDWDYSTEPEPYVDGKTMYVPRGKSLGGSSSMNAMLYVRGRPLDFDLWEGQGAPGWGWDDVLPYFKRAENNARGADEFHGVGGPVEVSEQRSPRRIGKDLLESAVAAGIPRATDYNGSEQDGVAPFQVFQKNGRRWSSADAYLKPAMRRPNLEVITGALVLGLELDGTRVTGVRYRRKGQEAVASAAREVVLSAGAIGSPQILQLSGIGNADDLREVGVEVRHELPGVGYNLQDHPFLGALFEVNDTDTLYQADKPKHLLEWALRRSGKLTSTVAEINAFVRTRPGLPAADIQFHMGAAYYENHGEETFDGHAVVIAPTLVSPKSRGKVWLASKDPEAKARILTNSLEHPDDLRSLVAGMKLAREIAAQEPLASKIVREIKPGPSVVEDEDLEDDIRKRLMLIYHPVGTCLMSDTADGAVVDSELRVHGLQGLRVADASVMPVITGGNTNAPTMMIAERAADLIRGRVGAGVAAPPAASGAAA